MIPLLAQRVLSVDDFDRLLREQVSACLLTETLQTVDAVDEHELRPRAQENLAVPVADDRWIAEVRMERSKYPTAWALLSEERHHLRPVEAEAAIAETRRHVAERPIAVGNPRQDRDQHEPAHFFTGALTIVRDPRELDSHIANHLHVDGILRSCVCSATDSLNLPIGSHAPSFPRYAVRWRQEGGRSGQKHGRARTVCAPSIYAMRRREAQRLGVAKNDLGESALDVELAKLLAPTRAVWES